MNRKVLSLLLLIFIVLSCKRQQSEVPAEKNIKGLEETEENNRPDDITNNYSSTYSDEVIELNNQAVSLLNRNNTESHKKALVLLDKAIRLDSNYHMAYSNKVTVLIRMKDYNAAIETCEYLVTSVRSDLPEEYVMLALLYDKEEYKTTADLYYKKAIQLYSKRIKDKNNVLDMVNKAQLTYILDKERGLNEIDSLIKVYPSDADLPIFKEYMFLDYDHQKALDDL